MAEGTAVLWMSWTVGLLDGTQGVAASANTGGGRGKVEEGLQSLILDIDPGRAPEWRIVVKMEFKDSMDMGGIQKGMQGVSFWFSKCAFTKTMGIDRDINGYDGRRFHGN